MKATGHIDPPLVSIIILNYNGKRFLDKCLTSVLKTNYTKFEVIFVDNGSDDSSVAYVVKKFGKNNSLRILSLPKNYGFAEGNNFGAKKAEGDYIVFLNNDTEVDPNWLKYLVKIIESDKMTGAAQPKLLLRDSKKFDSAGAFINYCGFVFNRGHKEEDKGQYDKLEEIFYAKGAAMIVKREVWHELGGFDPIFFLFFDETDLCWRIWSSGYRVVFVPHAVVYHVGGGTTKRVPYFLKYQEARNRIICLMKNHYARSLVKYLPLTLLLYLMNVFRYISKRDILSSAAIIKGSLWCVRNFKQIWKRRKIQQQDIRKERVEYLEKHVMIRSTIPKTGKCA